MKKIAVVTGARSEYGLLRWVIDEIHHATELQLQLIVTGGHLSPEQGLTDRKSTRLNSSHTDSSRMPSSA